MKLLASFCLCALIALSGTLSAQCDPPGTEDFETAANGTGCGSAGTLPTGWTNTGALLWVMDTGESCARCRISSE